MDMQRMYVQSWQTFSCSATQQLLLVPLFLTPAKTFLPLPNCHLCRAARARLIVKSGHVPRLVLIEFPLVKLRAPFRFFAGQNGFYRSPDHPSVRENEVNEH